MACFPSKTDRTLLDFGLFSGGGADLSAPDVDDLLDIVELGVERVLAPVQLQLPAAHRVRRVRRLSVPHHAH
eukprot:1805827-Rhodomonas_salina.1